MKTQTKQYKERTKKSNSERENIQIEGGIRK